MKFVNKNFDFIFNDTFIKDLSEAAHEYALTTQKQFRNDMKNGFAILKTTDDAIETTINRKLINHNKRTLVKDYNIFRDRLHSPIEDNTTLYLTKDKNEFNRNFNEIPYVKPVYDLLYDEFQQKITRPQIAGDSFPDKAYATTFDPIHTEAQIANAGLTDYDGISPTESFTNSLTFNEINSTGEAPYNPDGDNTDYFFNCNLERFGEGVYFDGLFNGNAQVNLTSGHMNGETSGNPYKSR
ncbi:hypothetical protein QTN25_003062 [Entamoeba marina]